jgi:SAM-dependent methyltransferase
VAIEQHGVGDAARWRTTEHARNWIERMDREHGHRDEELETLVSLMTFDVRAPIQVLELGAGHGLLTRLVLERFPRSHVLALDLNPVMIEEGQSRLGPFGDRVQYGEWDLAESGWPDSGGGPFDAEISSLALHHLERQRKSELAEQLFARLRPGGFFLNLDYVGAPSERLAERYAQSRIARDPDGHGRGGGDHGHDSLEPQLNDLRRAGFIDVEVFWKRAGLTIFGGTKPGA